MSAIKTFFRKLLRELNPRKPSFQSSETYWEDRYRTGGKSGKGSYNELAAYKAEIINKFVRKHDIETVIEHGCGDGNQLTYGTYPSYIGFDVSQEAISICRRKFKNDGTKTFKHNSEYEGEVADLVLSLDVIYHLVEDEVFLAYMQRLFGSAARYVIIYSSDKDEQEATMAHVRHRNFTKHVSSVFPEWQLVEKIPNKHPQTDNGEGGSHSDFFIYRKTTENPADEQLKSPPESRKVK